MYTGSIPVGTSIATLQCSRALSSAGERFLDVEEVTGSIPVAPTSKNVSIRGAGDARGNRLGEWWLVLLGAVGIVRFSGTRLWYWQLVACVLWFVCLMFDGVAPWAG